MVRGERREEREELKERKRVDNAHSFFLLSIATLCCYCYGYSHGYGYVYSWLSDHSLTHLARYTATAATTLVNDAINQVHVHCELNSNFYLSVHTHNKKHPVRSSQVRSE